MNRVHINAHIIVTVDAVDVEQEQIEAQEIPLSDEQAAKAASWNTDTIRVMESVCLKTKNTLTQGMARLGNDGKWQVHFFVSEV